MKSHALEAAARGFRVFRLRYNDKRPLKEGWQKEATREPEGAEKLWSKALSSNIGIATGHGLLVVDIDVKHGNGYESLASLEAQHSPLPPTYTVGTTTGGEHRYFSFDPSLTLKNTTAKLGNYIDTRGEGGYVAGAHSQIDGKSYTIKDNRDIVPAPQWVVDLISHKKPAPRKSPIKTPPTPSQTTPYGRRALDEETSRVSVAIEGTRNATLNEAAFAAGQLIGGGEIDPIDAENELFYAAELCGLGESEARATINSGITAGKTDPRSAPPSTRSQQPPPSPPSAEPTDDQDTDPDRPVIKLMANQLSLSENTIHRHVQAILDHFGATNRAEALFAARSQGLVH